MAADSALAFCSALALGFALLLLGCHHSAEEIYRGVSSDRMIELRSGTAYLTEGTSTQAVPYDTAGDHLILHLPFMNAAFRRMPDGSLVGMGESLVRVDAATAALLGTYESPGGDYRLHLNPQGRAIYTRLGQADLATYTLSGNRLTLRQGSRIIAFQRNADGTLETAGAVLRKLS